MVFLTTVVKSASESWSVVFLKCVGDILIQIHPFTYANISRVLYCYEVYQHHAWWVLCDIIVYRLWAENIRYHGKAGYSSACTSSVYQTLSSF